MTALRVLHVEDEPDIRAVVAISLGLDPDFVTRSCSSGQEALEISTDWPPDIILLDVMMPVMDGPATFSHLRNNAQTTRIPVVFMTACVQAGELDRFRSLGAAGVIAKPFDPMTLAASVRAYIQGPEDRLGALRSVFLRRVQDDADALVKHRSGFKSGRAALATLIGIRDIAHGLAGAGGIFGFSEIGDAAAALEEAVVFELNGTSSVADVATALEHLFDRIEKGVGLQRARSHTLLGA
jgi:two-component system OmpR family response regulator